MQPSAQRILRYWLPVVAYTTLIFSLSAQPHPEQYVPIRLWDKFGHLAEYGLLGILTFRAFRHAGPPRLSPYSLVLAIAASTLYGVTDEIHQMFVPMRNPDVVDVIADGLGSVLGALLCRGVAAAGRVGASAESTSDAIRS